MKPRAFAGAGNLVVLLDDGAQDAGSPVMFHVESSAVAPAGVTGDCAFDRVRQTITWSANANITVTPILDGKALLDSAHTIRLASSGSRESAVFEVVLRRESANGSSYALRGTWFALRFEGEIPDGDLIIDPAVLEVEVLTPTQERPD